MSETSELLQTDSIHNLFFCWAKIRRKNPVLIYLRESDGATLVNMTSRLGSINRVASGKFDHIPASYGMRIAKAAQNMLSASLSINDTVKRLLSVKLSRTSLKKH